MSDSYEFDTPEVFTAGTVGPPGQRAFYLQVRDQGEVASVKLEKQQVQALSQVLRGMLEELPAPEPPPPSDLDLAEPTPAAWPVSSIGVGYERTIDRLLLVVEEAVPTDDEGEPEIDAASVRVLLTRSQVLAFCDRADAVVAKGRPPCPYCTRPLDAGRPCACLN
jgi:uncharacterized repeat protein (TIGR03847 family)